MTPSRRSPHATRTATRISASSLSMGTIETGEASKPQKIWRDGTPRPAGEHLGYDDPVGRSRGGRMRRVAVIGVGVTKFGRHERSSAELFAEAAVDSLADAGLPPSAVQALYYGNVVGGETEKQLHTGPQAASVLGIPTVPTTRFETACASSHAA